MAENAGAAEVVEVVLDVGSVSQQCQQQLSPVLSLAPVRSTNIHVVC